MDKQYKLISENPESTIVSEYNSERTKETNYQTESDLEKEFIKQLTSQAYEYLPIHTGEELITNLRHQIEKLNNYKFDDDGWNEFFKTHIKGQETGKDAIAEKTKTIQKDSTKTYKLKDGTTKNIKLLDKDNIHNNYLQVINQYVAEEGNHKNRYDVTILVNGLPLIHIELKRRGIDIKEAFNQINRYQKESFWSEYGLFQYIQIFVISNGTYTKYYSNTTRESHIKELNKTSNKKTSHSFEFTSWWADSKNKPITDLIDFTKTFFAKHTILNILTKYCVFTTDNILLVMRPYQIFAAEQILNKIKISINNKTYGTINAGGYVWHTTGSGKTLTSFKTAQLATEIPEIDKVLFVVDRKDLDCQTMKEYDNFEKGAANSNTSTAVLKGQLEDSNARIIITTIQKLTYFIKQNKDHPVYNKHIVFIFDECHRSQFGDQHSLIIKNFKKYNLFGFTGTPIFSENAYKSGTTILKTTEQIFGDKLHTYTIVDATNDKNVLPFKVYYHSTMKAEENIKDEKVQDINREKALMSPLRISKIVDYILTHFNQYTKRNTSSYEFNKLTNIKEISKSKKQKIEEIKEKIRMTGFNSIFAVSSIEAAKLYYTEFQKQMEQDINKKLKIALIYSYSPNTDDNSIDNFDDENPENTEALDKSSRDFLEEAIKDYNKLFNTTYDTSSDKFQNYYKDVSLRVKNRDIDLLIVVNMFLTGFDAPTLNTLWVDKNLKMQGLLQAYSRTNRILNSIKAFGNIVCFRNLEEETNKSIALFGNKDAKGIVLLKTFDEYYKYGYKDDKGLDVRSYLDLISELQNKYPVGQMINTEKDQKDFIKLYGNILKLRNILETFDDFKGQEILTQRDTQDYHSMYIELYESWRNKNKSNTENINDDLVFEIELIKQVEINIDYILMLVKKYQETDKKDKEIIINIEKSIDSSIELRSKKDLIINFINSLIPNSDIYEEWKNYINQQRKIDLDKIISEEKLKEKETYNFIENSFKNGFVQDVGTNFSEILPPISLFTKDNKRDKKTNKVLDRINLFFNKYKDII